MRVVAIEEHFTTPDIPPPTAPPRVSARLADLDDRRLSDMDAAGIDLQVISLNAPGTQQLERRDAVRVASRANEHLARAVQRHPGRFGGFATLPTPAPQEACAELERAVREYGFAGVVVNGHTHGCFLDDQRFWPILETAEGLAAPLYLHPTHPTDEVRRLYYHGLPDLLSNRLATSGWGWHAETALHALRMVLSGVFDTFPGLQVILGHLGEGIPYSLDRIDEQLTRDAPHLEHRVADYFRRNFSITTSGCFSDPPLRCALETLGADRIMFAVDYPFSDNVAGCDWLDHTPLSPAERGKIAAGNAERLLRA